MIGREFIAIAVQLRTTRTEAAYRTRISRAYYAAFLEARQFAGERAAMASNRSSATHRLVAEALAPFDAQFQIDLGILRGMRNGADYDLDLSPETLALQADQASALAASVIARLDQYASSTDPDTRDLNDGEPRAGVISLDPLADYLPLDDQERDAVALILLSYPHLAMSILRMIPIIEDVYPVLSVELDTRTFDDWEPPLRLLIRHRGQLDQEVNLYDDLMKRIRSDGPFDHEMIQIFPIADPIQADGGSVSSRDQRGDRT